MTGRTAEQAREWLRWYQKWHRIDNARILTLECERDALLAEAATLREALRWSLVDLRYIVPHADVRSHEKEQILARVADGFAALASAQEPAAPAVMKAKQGLAGPMGRLP